MITLILFILILGLLVFVHELGHFIVARRNGVNAQEFGFGFPPRMCGFRKINGKYKFFWGAKEDIESEDTIYSVNWIPIGGFVKIKGEGDESKDEDSFTQKSVWKRFKIIAAGVSMNFILAMFLLSIGFWVGLPAVVDGDKNGFTDIKVQVIDVVKDSPAYEAGFEVGDSILAIDGNEIKNFEQVQELIGERTDQKTKIKVNTKGEEKEYEITPVFNEEANKAQIGIALVQTGIKSYPWYLAIWMGIKSTVLLIGQILLAFYMLLKNLIFTKELGMEVSGPVGIAVLTGQVARMGFVYLLQFTAILSINLGVINFLPFPALDGGKALFLLIERVRGHAVSQKIENAIHTAGFALLMLLIIIVTFKDVIKFGDIFTNLWNKITGV